jgi:hypothetical protein
MTAFQAFAEAPSAGQAGHIAASSNGFLGRTLVRAVDAAIDCALAVCKGATPGKTVKAPTTAAEAKACEGILLDPVYLNEIGAVATSFSAGQPATVLEDGYVWVNSEGTVAVDDPVYVRHTSDGGSNTTRGTLRNNSDGTVVIDTTSTVEGVYRVTLFNGVVNETFSYQTDGSATANEITTGLVAAIDASANYSAAGTTECTITLVAGSEITIVQLAGPTAAAEALYVVTDNQKAARLKGARWAKARTGAGLTKVRLQLRQD